MQAQGGGTEHISKVIDSADYRRPRNPRSASFRSNFSPIGNCLAALKLHPLLPGRYRTATTHALNDSRRAHT
jgi:uncharacterized protein YqjF (DUF2071 family)